jgi:hypothetical protein
VGVFSFGKTLAAIARERQEKVPREEGGQETRRRFVLCPFPPCSHASESSFRADTTDKHYEEIVRGFGNGALRAPPTPMSDHELSRAIAEFLRDAPSVDSVGALGRRLDPKSRL